MARRTIWVDSLESITVADGAQAAVNLLASSDVPPTGGTVIRVVYDLWIGSETVAGAWGVARDDIGIGVESLEAFNGGTHPDPNTETDHPVTGWMLRRRIGVGQNGTGTTIETHVMGDIRSARKVDRGILFFIIAHNGTLGTAFPVRVSGLFRSLLLLS